MTDKTPAERLFELQDEGYREFMAKLVPNIDKATIIGVRAPAMKKLAAELTADADRLGRFLRDVPHAYFDENLLHAACLSRCPDPVGALAAVQAFLPFVDNWAVSDSLDPRGLAADKAALKKAIRVWLDSPHEYTVRFAIGMLMQHFLEADFAPFCLEWVAAVEHDAYYVKMMVAWFFATALTKQYEAAVPYLENHRLPVWNHNKAIQKSIESYRIAAATKAYLRTLKRKA